MHPVPGCCQHPGCDVRRGHLAIRPRPSSAVCCPQLCDDQQPEALPEAAQLWCRLPWASPVVCEEEVFFFLVKKAYMPIDANHISNSKDR